MTETVTRDGEEYLFNPEEEEETETMEDLSRHVREDQTITTDHPDYSSVIYDGRNGGLQT